MFFNNGLWFYLMMGGWSTWQWVFFNSSQNFWSFDTPDTPGCASTVLVDNQSENKIWNRSKQFLPVWCSKGILSMKSIFKTVFQEIFMLMDFSTLFGPECTYSDGSSTLQKLSVLILSKVIWSMKWVGLWKKLTSLLLLSYNMKTSLICCMNGNRTIEVLVSQCKTVFSPLFPSLSSTSSSRGNCTDCRHSPLSYSSAGYLT